jgi:hypothetical protein
MPDAKGPDGAPENIAADELAYEPPPDLEQPEGGGKRTSPLALKLAAIAGIVLVVGAALLLYRAHHRSKVVSEALSQADALLRLDTAAGYRQAASLLEPIAQLDPLQGGSVRAFALAMLFADYRATEVEAEIENLLVVPGRAEVVPPYAQLAAAAVALGRREVGTATTAVARAGDGAWPQAMQARVALLAGNVEVALGPASAAAASGAFPPGLALHGDALRRLRKNPRAARAAYEAALAASPAHPRAAYGLAKLALSGSAPAQQAETVLTRLLDDRDATPASERGRAAVHLAAFRMRAGDRPGADAALAAAGLDGAARAWAGRAAIVAAENHGPYRAVSGAPPGLQSASDDDPGELSPTPPPPPPKVVAAKKVAAKKAVTPKKSAASKSAASKKAAAKKTAKKPSKR